MLFPNRRQVERRVCATATRHRMSNALSPFGNYFTRFLQAEQIPEFQADKVSLQVPDAVFGPAFNIANGASQVLGTLIQVSNFNNWTTGANFSIDPGWRSISKFENRNN